MINLEVVLEAVQIDVYRFYCWFSLFAHFTTSLISLPFPTNFYQLSINTNGVFAVLSDFMQCLQQTFKGIAVAGWHQVDQQLQGRNLIPGTQS